jgi:tripartite-type tricarboxylate transporter receptor subunit TctC
VVARLIAQKLSDRMAHQFYIENAAGAGGNIGAGRAAQAAPARTRRRTRRGAMLSARARRRCR